MACSPLGRYELPRPTDCWRDPLKVIGMQRYLKISEVVADLHVETEFLHALEAEGLIHLKRTLEDDLVISSEDAERVRVALLLTGELDVNLPGVEVIINMRESMLAMQHQFAEILDALVEEMRRHLQR
jgi:MerR family transcriptional regulator/heat shock protein HspR